MGGGGGGVSIKHFSIHPQAFSCKNIFWGDLLEKILFLPNTNCPK